MTRPTREMLIDTAQRSEEVLVKGGIRPEPGHGIIAMLVLASGSIDEDGLIVGSALLAAAAKVAGITGRQPIYEFVADVLVEVGK